MFQQLKSMNTFHFKTIRNVLNRTTKQIQIHRESKEGTDLNKLFEKIFFFQMTVSQKSCE